MKSFRSTSTWSLRERPEWIFLPGIAESRREHELHLRVYILHSRLDDEFAPVDHGEYVGERFKQGVEFAVR